MALSWFHGVEMHTIFLKLQVSDAESHSGRKQGRGGRFRASDREIKIYSIIFYTYFINSCLSFLLL